MSPPFAGEITAALHSPSVGLACIFRPAPPQRAYQAAKQQQGDSTGTASGNGSGSAEPLASDPSPLSGTSTGPQLGAEGTAGESDAAASARQEQQGQGRPGVHRGLTVAAIVEGGPEGKSVQGSVEVDFVGGFQLFDAHRKQVRDPYSTVSLGP